MSRKTETTVNKRKQGLGRILVATYIILALAATGRSVYQVVRKFDEAPLAYSLSVLAAVVYILATVALARKGLLWHRIAWVTLLFEFTGVLVVGTLSVLQPQLFAHPSVWSYFGAGYLFIPLVLPLLGMLWLRGKQRPEVAGA
ncbi:hypothetical protein EII31_02695 [Leucobacter sp. OH2974_COT-288]|uniref:Surface polysaccharide O-acyltransferase-like enzyme n=1 Tax=Canibacter oris TaxID=1365628 RepID=A0A840DD62_9MICO|nr:surface polysaccharide O-acyltransferase-like enzyme [Canibacter oris]RRD36489.1 hypothetical protein EII31_02695 [Leucobacter sp. OH2974_COT-288]